MNRRCARCKKNKPTGEFRVARKRASGFNPYCIPCDKLFQHEWYVKNATSVRQKSTQRNLAGRRVLYGFIREYLAHHPCVDCGERDIVVLEFDHVRGKKSDSICRMVRRVATLASIKAEIVKCDVRCANCHKRKTAKDFKWHKYP